MNINEFFADTAAKLKAEGFDPEKHELSVEFNEEENLVVFEWKDKE